MSSSSSSSSDSNMRPVSSSSRPKSSSMLLFQQSSSDVLFHQDESAMQFGDHLDSEVSVFPQMLDNQQAILYFRGTLTIWFHEV